ncbi:MAG: glycosyltransferase family 2 protein [Mycoplasmataceae bacterium]|jgi:glycosyltransferase involved in cell wall biosynthesis|nr:glycosyltransferase family 2 protein [Mycoplasmataceae bacterium]
MSKILTIVIPSYNAEKTINSTLLSLDYQCGKYFNVLIIDDGSAQPIQPYIQPWIERYPSIIKCIRVKNNNWGGCVNYAIKHVSTKFLKILDSDDTFFVDHMNSYLQHLQSLAKTKVDTVITSFSIKNLKTGSLMKRRYNLKKKIVYTSFDNLRFNKILSMHAFTWSLSLLKKIQPLPIKIPYTDNLLVFRTILFSKNVVLLPNHIFVYNYNFGDVNQSMSWEKTVKNLPKLKHIYHAMFQSPISNLGYKRTKLLIASIKQMFYLIILIISLDNDIYDWQRKQQFNQELNFIEPYIKDKNITKKIKSGYLRIINRRSIPLVIRINKFVLLTSQVGFLKMFKMQYKENKYEKIRA